MQYLSRHTISLKLVSGDLLIWLLTRDHQPAIVRLPITSLVAPLTKLPLNYDLSKTSGSYLRHLKLYPAYNVFSKTSDWWVCCISPVTRHSLALPASGIFFISFPSASFRSDINDTNCWRSISWSILCPHFPSGAISFHAR